MKQAQEMLKTLDFMMEMQPDSIKVGLTKGRSANLRVCGQSADLQVASLQLGADRPSSRYQSFWPVWLPACTSAKAALNWSMLTCLAACCTVCFR